MPSILSVGNLAMCVHSPDLVVPSISPSSSQFSYKKSLQLDFVRSLDDCFTLAPGRQSKPIGY